MTRPGVRFLRYGAVGVVGFLVDAGVLAVLVHGAAVNPFLARIGSFVVAATITWVLHRRYTFRDRAGAASAGQWVRFLGANGIGVLVNYGIYALLLAGFGWFYSFPVAAAVVGSVAGWGASYSACSRLVFPSAAALPGGSGSMECR